MKKCSHKISGVYKYVYDNEVIYVGKSDRDIESRIYDHLNDSKFRPYLDGCEIYYAELPDPCYSTIYETYLIGTLKPKLNDIMKYQTPIKFEIPDITWEKFVPTKKYKMHMSEAQRSFVIRFRCNDDVLLIETTQSDPLKFVLNALETSQFDAYKGKLCIDYVCKTFPSDKSDNWQLIEFRCTSYRLLPALKKIVEYVPISQDKMKLIYEIMDASSPFGII